MGQRVIFAFPKRFADDATEQQCSQVDAARAELHSRCPHFMSLLQARRGLFLSASKQLTPERLTRFEDALSLSFVRMAFRHGNWGSDLHEYHSEVHAMELLDRRLGMLLSGLGIGALPVEDWLALSLFCTCHDLRQREATEFRKGVGANEAASIDETRRILAHCGFCEQQERALYLALELMIAGSTFDARPAPKKPYNSAEAVSTGGPLAPRLGDKLRKHAPHLLEDPDVLRGLELALIASDLDTANVAEPFPMLVESALRLCREREMLAGRALHSSESAAPVLGFLSVGQERYFDELHRFVSEPGRRVLGPGKAANSPRLHALSERLQGRFPRQQLNSVTGLDIINRFLQDAAALSR